MTLQTGILLASMALGGLYGVALCWRPHSLFKLVVKTGSTALLALWAYLLGGPVLLVAGLALSSLGDFFLEADEGDRFLLPGMGAFFAIFDFSGFFGRLFMPLIAGQLLVLRRLTVG